MSRKIFSEMVGGNIRWSIYLSNERNKNELVIHSNGLGKTVYTNEEVRDSDVFKLMRLLDDYKYSFIKIDDFLKKVNRTCRHLKITRIENNMGGVWY